MNIVFDIDDTITNETEFMLKYASKYFEKKYKKIPTIKNENGYNISGVFNLDEIIENIESMSTVEIENMYKKIENGFWNTNFFKYMFYPLRKGSREKINKLIEQGYNIYFLSSRGKKTKENDTFINELIRIKVVPFLTKLQLKLNHVKYNQIKLVQNEDEKIEFIKKIKAKYVFDDQVSLLEKLPEFTQPVLMHTSHNNTISLNDDILKISSFETDEINNIILENKISKKKKYRNIKIYEKAFTEAFYVLVRSAGKNYFIKKFDPIISGIDNIPNDNRPIIYVGNHRNNFDPLIATLYIKDPTHWAALLRLFEAKENLFGRNDIYILRKLSSMLVKSMGSIPIARSTDENYKKINISSLSKIDEYIKLGSSIGFYPEGTLNRNPEKQNILPLASDAIFKIAKKNNAWIQPFSIVWTPKETGISNKVAMTFSEPIEPTNMSVDDIVTEWKTSVSNSIDDINTLFYELKELDDEQKKLTLKKHQSR